MNTHSAWCKQMFSMLAEGGVWGVPRSGLIFTKRDDKLVLTKCIPGVVPIEIQEDDYEAIKAHFAVAGILVVRS